MILRQKATSSACLAHPNGEVHEIDALHPYRLAGCGGNAGRGRGKLLGECGSTGCIHRTQANLSHVAQFRDAMVQRFEPITAVEEAHKQLRALRQTGRL